MPFDLAQYGIAIFAIGVFAYIVMQIFQAFYKRNERESVLEATIKENTQVMSRLTVLIEQQGTVLQRILDRLDSLWENRS